ncbi:Rhodanese domain protein [Gammaproteobacteria bacterium]
MPDFLVYITAICCHWFHLSWITNLETAMDHKIINSLTPRQSFEFLQQNPLSILIDCRSSMEFLFVGHPVGAVHVAWIDEPTWDINPNFVAEVRKVIQGRTSSNHQVEDNPLLLICRSGKRSLDAGKALLQAGFHALYNITEGFEGDLDDKHQRGNANGWRFHGLPWEQC